MNSVERIDAALAGREVDRPPFSFWYNFGLQHMSGEAVADAHIAFARRFKPDFLRVMNNYPYPIDSGSRSFDRPTDFLKIPVISAAEEGYWGHQIIALNKIVKSLKGEIWVVDSVDSPWTHLCRLASRDLVLKTASQRPELVRAALDIISSSQAAYLQKAMESGIKGIFFTMTEAGYDALDPITHEELCMPYNKRILDTVSELPFNTLRINGNRLYFDTLKGYSTAAVSWSHFRAKSGLVKGLLEWNRCVMGGINHETVAEETPESLRGYFEKYAEEFFINKIIITPSGILPTDISPYVLDGIADAVESLKEVGRFLRPEMLKVKSASKRPGVEEYYRSSERVSDYSKAYDNKVKRYELRGTPKKEKAEEAEEAEEAAKLTEAEEAEIEAAELLEEVSAAEAVQENISEASEEAEAAEENDAEEADEEDFEFGIVSSLDDEEPEEKKESSEKKTAPRFAAGFKRADYDRSEYDNDRRRFDAAYQERDDSRRPSRFGDRKPGRFENKEKRYGRREDRGSDRFSRSRDGRSSDRGNRFGSREGGRREDRGSDRFGRGRDGRSSDRGRFSEGRDSRFGNRSEKRGSFGGRKDDRFGGRREFGGDRNRESFHRESAPSGNVKRIRISRDRQK